ncbi:hypothetical protein [Streptomyces sp. NPDC092295]|uniref:hypothetical protein n=1 Tax=Streptomyces sp. NPDC092295 TaxID=3366011 RepID=UPI00380B4CCB
MSHKIEQEVRREGMYCASAEEAVTLTFGHPPREPHRWEVTCSHCGASWKTNATPDEFETRNQLGYQ